MHKELTKLLSLILSNISGNNRQVKIGHPLFFSQSFNFFIQGLIIFFSIWTVIDDRLKSH